MAKQSVSQLNNLQKQAFKARGKFFAQGRVRFISKAGKFVTAEDGDPIDPSDEDFEILLKTNAITDVDPQGPRLQHDDDLGAAGTEGL